jgi:hypothetical protein
VTPDFAEFSIKRFPWRGSFEREPNYLAIVDELAQLPETGAGQ